MDQLTLMDVLSWLWDHIVIIILVLSVFFEISKIKINPISWFTKLLFRPIRKDIDDMKAELKSDISNVEKKLSEEIDSVRQEVSSEHQRIDDLISSTELSEISRIRWNIIEFSNSIENGQKHIRDEYRHIKDDAKRYHDLVEKYNIDDGIIDEEMEKINKRYDENKHSNSVYF
jgi:hypothetical protein